MKKNIEVKRPDHILSYFGKEKNILAVITFTGILYNVGMAAGPYFEGQLAQCLYDIISGDLAASAMVRLAVMYVIVILSVQGVRAVKRYFVRIFASDVSRSMRHHLYNSLTHMTEKQLKQEKTGSLMTKAIADVDACSEGMRKFTTEIFDTGVVMITYLGMLFALDVRLTFLAVAFTPAAYFIAEKLKKKVTAANASYKESGSRLNQLTMDRIANAVTYRLFGREDNRNDAYEQHLEDYEKKSAKANVFESSLTPIYDAIAMMGVLAILYFGSRNVTGDGWTVWNIASFTTYLACFTKLAVKASHAAKMFNAVQKARVSWKRIQPLMKPAREDPDGYSGLPVEAISLTMEDVSCGDNSSCLPKLSGISFTVNPGEIVGVTGRVASGKSLLGKVLIGQADYSGSVLLDGKELKEMKDEERFRYISYMGHETEILSTTIEENVTLGDGVDAEKWLRAVCLDKEVSAMDKALETVVGDAGTKMSGGQQARLALARTLAHARSVLVLDDPLASVDKNTETEILDNLRRDMKGRVILLISHRLSHFPEMDHVLFLHDGKAEFSTHEALMKSAPDYADLFEKERSGGERDEKEK